MKATKRELTHFLLTRVAVNSARCVRLAKSFRRNRNTARLVVIRQGIRDEFRDIRDAMSPAAWREVIKESRAWTKVAKEALACRPNPKSSKA